MSVTVHHCLSHNHSTFITVNHIFSQSHWMSVTVLSHLVHFLFSDTVLYVCHIFVPHFSGFYSTLIVAAIWCVQDYYHYWPTKPSDVMYSFGNRENIMNIGAIFTFTKVVTDISLCERLYHFPPKCYISFREGL